MATIVKLSSGNYRVQVGRKGQYASKTFRRKADAYAWALEAERRSDQGRAIKAPKITGFNTFGQLIDLHIVDMLEVGKPLGRSKEFALRTLRKHLGKIKLPHLSRGRIISFGRQRAKAGAGPATLSADISYIHTIISHSAAVHGVKISTEEIDLARIALRRLGLIGRSNERDRRPTQIELDRLISYFENFSNTEIPVARIIKFAIATGMRQSEICRITWEDVDARTRCVTVRDRKDPRHKHGNHQRVSGRLKQRPRKRQASGIAAVWPRPQSGLGLQEPDPQGDAQIQDPNSDSQITQPHTP
ncbi:tyrosine-type recombinase/integrase [Hellea sp.]|nr:tyrosine-type recombinase/integrase [Hellea sp.]